MKTLVLATQNPGKISEIRDLLPESITVVSCKEVGITEDIPETGDTLEANAEQKARYMFDRCGLPCLADDTGLEVEALDGAPGVYSARYAGPEKDSEKNIDKLLLALAGNENRRARFRTVLAMVSKSGTQFYEGIVRGTIAEKRMGNSGFGYDPVFIPEGETRSFAQMTKAEKNQISHRGRALQKAFGSNQNPGSI
ncbi:MAG: RdgB/HAM1 family non-canonical purine NTP pyrophosphatase [Cryomorphaceae bacterium]|nr:RdgB/HAM1 family non-canonical purine NTP pyrophosphatase [Cryomorphaceae bacterium]